MAIINRIAQRFTKSNLERIDAFESRPILTQSAVLTTLIQQGANTEYGRKYGLKEDDTYEQFQRKLPITSYEDLEPYIQRMRRGEANVLWPKRTKWFAKSSGTTGSRSKYIPVTKESLENCHYRGPRDVLALYIKNNPQTTFFLGKGLTLGGSHQIEATSHASREGDLSAILLQNIPLWADMIRTPSRSTALQSNWHVKLEGIARESILQRVTSLSGVPSWNMVMIKYILDVTGKSNLTEVWPDLEVFFHGGVNFTPYRSQYEQLIPSDKMHYMETYNASEGFFAIQDNPAEHDLLLMLDYGVFYEFIPMNELHARNGATIPLEEVRPGVNYAMLISSTNGLWRYLIGDTVEFTSTSPYKIRLTGRTKHFINAFGEELIVDNAEYAIGKACKATGSIVEEYTAAPAFMSANEKGRHEWYIEFATPPQSMESFIAALDSALRDVNSDYDAKRTDDVTLLPPLVHSLPVNTFMQWMDASGKLGGQNKVPRLFNDRTHIESLQRHLGISKERL